MDFKKILNGIIEFLLFIGTLITICCLMVFVFVTTSTWLSILSGLGAIHTLLIYDRYRRNFNKNT